MHRQCTCVGWLCSLHGVHTFSLAFGAVIRPFATHQQGSLGWKFVMPRTPPPPILLAGPCRFAENILPAPVLAGPRCRLRGLWPGPAPRPLRQPRAPPLCRQRGDRTAAAGRRAPRGGAGIRGRARAVGGRVGLQGERVPACVRCGVVGWLVLVTDPTQALFASISQAVALFRVYRSTKKEVGCLGGSPPPRRLRVRTRESRFSVQQCGARRRW